LGTEIHPLPRDLNRLVLATTLPSLLKSTPLSRPAASLDNFVFPHPLHSNVSKAKKCLFVDNIYCLYRFHWCSFNRSFSMPTCTCKSYACNGKDLTPRAFENHQREDKRRKFSQAFAKATQVCDKQTDDIATYISSLMLSDSATGGISTPGGRLWSRSVQDDDSDDIADYIPSLTLSDSTGSDAAGGLILTDTLLRPHHVQVSRRYSPIKDVLSELDTIEKELGSLLLAAGPQLKGFAAPLPMNECINRMRN
jgi:hypothetical protein